MINTTGDSALNNIPNAHLNFLKPLQINRHQSLSGSDYSSKLRPDWKKAKASSETCLERRVSITSGEENAGHGVTLCLREDR